MSRCSRLVIKLESLYKDNPKISASLTGVESRDNVFNLGAMDSWCQRDFKRDLNESVNAWSRRTILSSRMLEHNVIFFSAVSSKLAPLVTLGEVLAVAVGVPVFMVVKTYRNLCWTVVLMTASLWSSNPERNFGEMKSRLTRVAMASFLEYAVNMVH